MGAGRGRGFNVNIPLNSVGASDTDYLTLLTSLILPLASQFSPQLVLVSAGYDAALGDPEGEMNLSPGCYAHFIRALSGLPGCRGRVLALLEGGYCLTSLAESAAQSLASLLGDPPPPLELTSASEAVWDTVTSVLASLSPYWSCFQVNTYKLTRQDNIVKIQTWDTENMIIPEFKFEPPENWPPASGKFDTRDYYPLRDKESQAEWDRRVAEIVIRTERRSPKYKLG